MKDKKVNFQTNKTSGLTRFKTGQEKKMTNLESGTVEDVYQAIHKEYTDAQDEVNQSHAYFCSKVLSVLYHCNDQDFSEFLFRDEEKESMFVHHMQDAMLFALRLVPSLHLTSTGVFAPWAVNIRAAILNDRVFLQHRLPVLVQQEIQGAWLRLRMVTARLKDIEYARSRVQSRLPLIVSFRPSGAACRVTYEPEDKSFGSFWQRKWRLHDAESEGGKHSCACN
jgi:hypothetical protein